MFNASQVPAVNAGIIVYHLFNVALACYVFPVYAIGQIVLMAKYDVFPAQFMEVFIEGLSFFACHFIT
ncbi:hypothetical protein D3C87_2168800 [compost metagenome]